MMYAAIWIEGEAALNTFCLRRFRERPQFCETMGVVGPAKIYEIYKQREGHGYVDMYLLYMACETGTLTWDEVEQKMLERYETIRLDRTAILRG